MNREILFRAKHVHAIPELKHFDGRWVYGYLSDKNHINTPELEGEFLIDPKTVCQYTGLTDKNGRKIFEGDIVETVCDGEQNPNYVVIWDKGELDFKVTNGEERYKGNYEYLGYCDEIIVIGNIFDNPELLRGA